MEEPFCADIPPGTRLIETFGLWPGEGARRWGAHRARMIGAAARLGFACAPERLDAAVAGLGAPVAPLRCRLTLDAGGAVEITSAPLGPAAGRWRVALAPERLCADDPWLRVKTTQRALYDRARAALPAGVDELVFCNTDGAICEGTITSVFVEMPDGARLTPALGCGLLPGVLRAEMLAQGWREARLTPADLAAARAVLVGNSLRGLIAAEWLGAL